MKLKTFRNLQVGDVVTVRTKKQISKLSGVEPIEPWDDVFQIYDSKSKMIFQPWIPTVCDEFYGAKMVVERIGEHHDTVRLDGKKLGYGWVVRKMLAERYEHYSKEKI